MSSPMKSLEDRYYQDASFHALVTAIETELEKVSFTPSEVREAAMYACMRFECRHPRTFPLVSAWHDPTIGNIGPGGPIKRR